MMREPSTGELRWLVTLRKWQDVPSFDNAVNQTFDVGVKVWAKLTPVAGSTYYGSKQTGDDITHRFEIRYHDGITAEHVIELNNIRYRVKRMSHMNGGRRFTALEVKELGAIPQAVTPDNPPFGAADPMWQILQSWPQRASIVMGKGTIA